MRALLIGIGLVAMTASATLGDDPGHGGQGSATPVQVLPMCSGGFTASPAQINSDQTYGQAYTCSDPGPACTNGFHFQEMTVQISPSTASTLGSSEQVDAVPVKSGKMVYTCAEPQSNQ